ncbi:MAG: ImmA/IrrE family metallo-endopeptidase [Syntrophobacteraceae bacterium]|jgi:Zn-dependent peptidase ImmA (M78 family)
MNALSRRELALRAAAHAELVRLKCNIQRTSAVDPFQVAEMRGCEIRLMSLPSLEGAYAPTPRPVIILGSQRPAGRRAFTCVHELGHHEFKHGTRLEELNATRFQSYKDPDEFVADMFGAFLLMSQGSIRRALKDRQIQPDRFQSDQAFGLASFFGVGYSTLIEHMTWTLRLLQPKQRETLLKIQPKELKAQYGCPPQSELILVDELWKNRAVDLEIGDILVLQKGVVLEDSPRLNPHGTIDGQQMFRAVSRGYVRASLEENEWAVNIRISSKHYQGLARYRFLPDPEEDSNVSG